MYKYFSPLSPSPPPTDAQSQPSFPSAVHGHPKSIYLYDLPCPPCPAYNTYSCENRYIILGPSVTTKGRWVNERVSRLLLDALNQKYDRTGSETVTVLFFTTAWGVCCPRLAPACLPVCQPPHGRLARMKSRPRGRRRSSCSPSRSSIESYRVVLVNLSLNGKLISIGVCGLTSKENLGLVDYAPVGILPQEISLAKGWPD